MVGDWERCVVVGWEREIICSMNKTLIRGQNTYFSIHPFNNKSFPLKLEAALSRTMKPRKGEIKPKIQGKADNGKFFVHFGGIKTPVDYTT